MSERAENLFCVDPSDFDGMLEIMDAYGDTEMPFSGVNDEGEDVSISVFSDRIVVETYQSNGWVRENIFWRDGTREELFDGKWK